MAPKKANNNNNNKKKSKKQVEEDEFEKLLSELNKATKQAGKEKEKELEREREIRAMKEKKHEEILNKSKESDFEKQLKAQQKQMEFNAVLRMLMNNQGAFLLSPNTKFDGEVDNTNPHFDIAVGWMQGWRRAMEDNHFIKVKGFPNTEEEALLGVFDGHSGKQAADTCVTWLPKLCLQHYKDGAIDFHQSFLEMDAKLESLLKDGSGCTSVVVHITPKAVTCASVGDSRAVLCRQLASVTDGKDSEALFEVDGVWYEAVALAHDHKPELDAERERIEAIGGFVEANRVNGQLAMSRALGDFMYKTDKDKPVQEQLVIPVPTILQEARTPLDRFVVIACDGIFDVLTNKELCENIVKKKYGKEEEEEEGKEKLSSNKEICEAICRECLAPMDETSNQPSRAAGTDNMTIMIAELK